MLAIELCLSAIIPRFFFFPTKFADIGSILEVCHPMRECICSKILKEYGVD